MYIRALPGNRKGFTLVEAMIVIAIMGIIAAALVMTLQVGELSSGLGTATVDIQSDTKMLASWVIRDIRQAKIQEMFNNTPTTDHMKFNIWTWSNASLSQAMSDQYIEYEYTSGTQTLTRRFIEGGTTQNTWNFTGVLMSPFYTSYTDEGTNSFNNQTMLDNRKLVVVIKKGATVRGRSVNFTVVEEVRIRNE